MISCTEFVPLYSDFFKYLDAIGGHAEVEKYWAYVSEHRLGDKNNPQTMISFLERAEIPFFGARDYWGLTLSEEKSDYISYVDNEKHFSFSHMRRCPSKGKLIDIKHNEPYYDYCGHCEAIFKPLLARYGLTYEMDLTDCDKAECRSLLFETGHRPSRAELAALETKRVDEVNPSDNEYYHPGFHISCDIALRYCGLTFGDAEVEKFLAEHTRAYYSPRISDIKERGIPALVDWIREYYAIERASDSLIMEYDGKTLTVTVSSDPAIDFMRKMNHTPSKYHGLRTEAVLRTVCEDTGLDFSLNSRNEDGGISYTVKKK